MATYLLDITINFARADSAIPSMGRVIRRGILSVQRTQGAKELFINLRDEVQESIVYEVAVTS